MKRGRRSARVASGGRLPSAPRRRPVLVTGGAGFVGTNLAARLLAAGEPVIVYDNLSRPGVRENLRWLETAFPSGLDVHIADVRDERALRAAVSRAGWVVHLAAQVAVTTSLDDPLGDFEVNARGTLNLLEAVRALDERPPVLFTSTNKVYGGLEDVSLVRRRSRWEPSRRFGRAGGIAESRPLAFHSPYACSKGCADQYVLDYTRCYQLPATVFRMSCIYGPHQRGTEDQGWVAHFLLRALAGEPIRIYGDGYQVRDVLHVEDLVQAMLRARKTPGAAGRAFNVGGGAANVLSLVELIDLIEELHGARPDVDFRPSRTGDQRYYVSDTGAFEAASGWKPRVAVREGVTKLYRWLRERGEERAVRTPTAAIVAAGAS